MSRARKLIPAAAALLVGGGLFYYAFRDIHFSELTKTLKALNPLWLPVLLVLPAVDLGFRAVRWRILLAPVAKADTKLLFQLEAIGIAINNVLFLRLGELARAVVGGREMGASTISVLATIVVERLCDLCALLWLLAVFSLLVPASVGGGVVKFAWLAAVGSLAVLAVITLFGARIRESLVFIKRWPAFDGFVGDIVRGSQGLRSAASALRVAGLSLALWMTEVFLGWLAAVSLGFKGFTLAHAAFVVVSSAAGSALPAVPGAFGNYEAAVRAILEQFGYTKGAAVSYAAFIHIIQYAVMTTLGLVFFYRLGHTFAGLRTALSNRGKS